MCLYCLQEAVQCEDCSKESHVHQYTQYFFTVIAAAISAVCIAEGNQELGLTLQAIEGQTQKSCDSDVGKILTLCSTLFPFV